MNVFCVSTPCSLLKNYYHLFDNIELKICNRIDVEHWFESVLSDYSQPVLDKINLKDHHRIQSRSMLELESKNNILISENNQSAFFLEFWQEEYKDSFFLLLYSKPEIALARAIDQGIDSKEFLKEWLISAQHILFFLKKNRQMTMLVNADSSLDYPEKFLQSFCHKTNFLNKGTIENKTIVESGYSSIALWLSKEIIAEQTVLIDIQLQLEASAIPIAPAQDQINLSVSDLEKAYKEYIEQLNSTNIELESSKASDKLQQNVIQEFKTKNQYLQLQLDQVGKDRKNHLSDNKEIKNSKVLNENDSQLNAELSSDQKKTKKLEQEKQLFQSQTKKGLKSEIKNDDVKDNLNAHLPTIHNQLKLELENRKELEEENELLLLQLHQAQEALELIILENKELSDSISDNNQEVIHKTSNNLSKEEEKLYKKVKNKDVKILFNSVWYKKCGGSRLFSLHHYLKKGWKRHLSPHPLFDPDYYIEANGLSSLDKCPLIHFIAFGNKFEYCPHPLFDTKWYLKAYPDVKESGMNPLIHYLEYGVSDERNPSKNFNTRKYLRNNPDVDAAGINPLLHYVLYGQEENRIVW